MPRRKRCRSRICVHHIDHLAVHQAEIAGIHRDFDIGDAEDQAVKQRSGESLEPGFAFALGAHRINHLITLPPFRDHLQDDLRRVLQIGVDDHHRLAAE